MTGVVVVDSNLLVLLVVGTASKDYVARHKNTRDHFDVDDFELLGLLIAQFSEIVLLPHIVTETSNLAGQIGGPARGKIMTVLGGLIASAVEIPVASVLGAARTEFPAVGITDAVTLYFCGLSIDGVSPTPITIDGPLADRAHSLGYSVIDYKQAYQS